MLTCYIPAYRQAGSINISNNRPGFGIASCFRLPAVQKLLGGRLLLSRSPFYICHFTFVSWPGSIYSTCSVTLFGRSAAKRNIQFLLPDITRKIRSCGEPKLLNKNFLKHADIILLVEYQHSFFIIRNLDGTEWDGTIFFIN